MSDEDDRQIVDQQLPFSESKQDAVLGFYLTTDSFFMQAKDRLKPEWFLDKTNENIFRAKVGFYEQFKKIPSVEEVINLPEFQLEDARVRGRVHAKISKAVAKTNEYHLAALLPEITDWMQSRIIAAGIRKSAKLFQDKKIRESHDHAKLWTRMVEEVKFEEDLEERFDRYQELFDNQQAEYEDAITIGNPHFDKLITPMANHGSLLRGDTTMYLASTNTGKSTAIITTIAHNLKHGKSVMWLVHEGRPDDLKIKLWCALLDKSQAQVFAMYKTPEGRRQLDMALLWINKHLTFVPMMKAGLCVEEVETIIRRKWEERAAKLGQDKSYVLLADDYPAKLSTKKANGGQWAPRQIIHESYNYFVQLALEYKFHSLLAIQTNREGSKVNRGDKKDEGRLLMMEDVSESFGTMQIATNVISINRDHAAANKDRVTFFICKSRSNVTGWAFCTKSKYSHALTHGPDLDATWWRGTSSMSAKIDDLLAKHKNGLLPDDEV